MSIVIPSIINYWYNLNRNRKTITTKFKVWGNCGKCKIRIEKSLKIKGVKKAEWNMDTKLLSVTFNPKQINITQIHEKILSTGHDTSEYFTETKLYKKLPACCKYIRDGKSD